jgi:hypothetical protein
VPSHDDLRVLSIEARVDLLTFMSAKEVHSLKLPSSRSRALSIIEALASAPSSHIAGKISMVAAVPGSGHSANSSLLIMPLAPCSKM